MISVFAYVRLTAAADLALRKKRHYDTYAATN